MFNFCIPDSPTRQESGEEITFSQHITFFHTERDLRRKIPEVPVFWLLRQAIGELVGADEALRLVILPTSSDSSVELRDEKLIALIAESRTIITQITKNPGRSIPVLATEQGRCRVRMMKVAKLACLAPDIVTAIIEGRQPTKLTPSKLLSADLPLAWAEQKRVLGFG